MFTDKNLVVTRLFLEDVQTKAKVDAFCASNGLKMGEADYYCGIFDGDKMLAGGGFSGNVIKYVAVDPSARSMNLTNTLISHLREELLSNGAKNIFVYTKIANKDLFESLAFYTVGESEDTVLLESHPRGIKNFCRSLQEYKTEGDSVAIVMNANPFTNGHKYLVQQAKKEGKQVFVFVVETDKSAVKFSHRFQLVKKGLEDIEGVTVLKGGDYIVSQVTFPNYFLKEQGLVDKNCAQIDADVFGRFIAPSLNIKKRFVGQEPTDVVTADYNRQLQKVLARYGVRLVEIDRLCVEGKEISASTVRKAIASRDDETLQKILPPTTLEFLRSEESSYLKKA